MAFVCARCGAVFATRWALGGHLSFPTCAPAHADVDAVADVNADDNTDVNADDKADNADGHADVNADDVPNAGGNNAAPAPIMSTLQLLQRPIFEYQKHRVIPLNIRRQGPICDTSKTFKLHQTQEAYVEYCNVIRQEYSEEFWRCFSAVYLEQNIVIDKVLQACRSTFIRGKKMKLLFDTSVRAIRARMLSTAGDFPSLIMHSVTIDLREFELPGITDVKFRFINPLWAWAASANDMMDAGHTINFEPKSMYHESTNELLYGAGVAFGKKIQWAFSRTPAGGKPGLFGISIDGADSGISNRSMYPICVHVLNFDGADTLACALLGYIPALDVPKVFKKRKVKLFLSARAHVFQKCVGAILDEIENVSEHGFAADLGGVRIRLHPFLVAFQVDSKERKTYFGLKSDRFGGPVEHHMCTSHVNMICERHM